MKTTVATASKDQQIQLLTEQVQALEHQLDWFKRQLFGRKSEKQIIDNPAQATLFEAPVKSEADSGSTEVKAHKRKSNKKHNWTGSSVSYLVVNQKSN